MWYVQNGRMAERGLEWRVVRGMAEQMNGMAGLGNGEWRIAEWRNGGTA